MRLLITGGLGFIGSNFILNTLEKHKDFQITNVDAQIQGSNLENLKKIENNDNYSFVNGDITNENLMDKLISNSDSVINFAAESHVDRSIENSEPFIQSNIVGVNRILNLIKKYNKKFIQISTDEVFGSLKEGSASESFKFNPSSPYAASKAAAELLVKSFFTTYDLDVMITRCTNNYGPRQFTEKLIPKVISLAIKNKKIPIFGNGTNVRDWIYVDDHCDAIEKVLLQGKSGESYNISSDNELDNIYVIKKILKILDKKEELMEFVDDRPGHDFRYSLNSSKIKKNLFWKPSTKFTQGLEKTIEWFEKNPKFFKKKFMN
jgi:dTDP-glucose 4,6-dehydratase